MATIETATRYRGETYGPAGGLILDEFGQSSRFDAAFVVRGTDNRLVIVVAEPEDRAYGYDISGDPAWDDDTEADFRDTVRTIVARIVELDMEPGRYVLQFDPGRDQVEEEVLFHAHPCANGCGAVTGMSDDPDGDGCDDDDDADHAISLCRDCAAAVPGKLGLAPGEFNAMYGALDGGWNGREVAANLCRRFGLEPTAEEIATIGETLAARGLLTEAEGRYVDDVE